MCSCSDSTGVRCVPNYHKVGDTAAVPWFPRELLLPVLKSLPQKVSHGRCNFVWYAFSMVQCGAQVFATKPWHCLVWQVYGTVQWGGQWSAQFFAGKWENNVNAGVNNCAMYTLPKLT